MRRGIILNGVSAAAVLVAVGLAGCERSEPAPEPVALDPARVTAALDAAEAYLVGGDRPKAAAILTVLIDRVPDSADGHEMLGRVELFDAVDADRRGDADAARTHRVAAFEHYTRATGLAPSAGLHQNCGVIAMGLGRFTDAAEHFTSAERLDPGSPQHPLYAAQVYLQQGDVEAADAALGRALALDPDEPVAHASRAVVAMEREQFEAALGHIQEARTIAPGDVRFRVQEARIHRRRGEPRIALDLLIGLGDGDRADRGVSEEMAASYAALDDQAAVAEVWSNRFAHHPEDDHAAASAGLAILRAGEPEAARWWLAQARTAVRGKGQPDPAVGELAAAVAP